MKRSTELIKRNFAIILAIILLFSLCSCGKGSPKDRLPDAVKEYVSTNYRIRIGGYVSESVNVDVASVIETKTNEWAVLGTYTVKIQDEIMSAKFGLVATYDEATNKFTFSKEEFDEFK